jgi:ribosomal protein S17E
MEFFYQAPPTWAMFTKTMKKVAQATIEKCIAWAMTSTPTSVCEQIVIISSKKLCNKITSYVTHLMKQIRRGPKRAISIKLQEEEKREIFTFPRSQPWIRRSLKLTLTLRKC